MSINPDYFKYLEHFGSTVTVGDLSEEPRVPDMVALRHDVDYDLDLALEMSYWENRQGIRSTYYLLHTAGYWSDPRLFEKCLQIQDLGHEVGLHLNVLTEWIKGGIDDTALRIKELATPLRKAGVRLSGTSAHGDPLCYEHQFINYWCFSELRPSDPITTESGLSAEGISVGDQKFRIKYPGSHEIVRQDGKALSLWSTSMKELGFEYDASHVTYDTYFTDSGGGWYRSEDPLKQNLKSGRYLVLMHPLYWRGHQKIYFFLSTARSGSKWLVNFLEQATPLKARHEFSLNHHFKNGEFVEEKRTAEGFTDLVNKKDEAKDLLIEARTWLEKFPQDYAEANVYLERFLSVMKEVFPDSVMVHLHRGPKDVVRSIINRDWYDTPEDNKHPIMGEKAWDNLNQFEKACCYVRETNESLLNVCQDRLDFEQMVTDINYLIEKLRSLNIPVFPRLATAIYGKKINQNYNYEFPEYREWTEEHKELFHSICDPVNVALGYESQDKTIHSSKNRHIEQPRLKHQKFSRTKLPEVIFEMDFQKEPHYAYSLKGCKTKAVAGGIEIVPEGGQHAHLLIGGGKWNKLRRGEGWEPKIAHYYRGVLDAEISANDSVHLFCLMYDKKRELIAKKSLGQIRQRNLPYKFSFKVRSNASRFNIAIYMSVANLPDKVILKTIKLEMLAL